MIARVVLLVILICTTATMLVTAAGHHVQFKPITARKTNHLETRVKYADLCPTTNASTTCHENIELRQVVPAPYHSGGEMYQVPAVTSQSQGLVGLGYVFSSSAFALMNPKTSTPVNVTFEYAFGVSIPNFDIDACMDDGCWARMLIEGTSPVHTDFKALMTNGPDGRVGMWASLLVTLSIESTSFPVVIGINICLSTTFLHNPCF
jgi:hypothetical protein